MDAQYKQLEDVLAACYTDTGLLCKTLFPEDFFAPFNDLHNQIFDLIDHSDAKKLCIAAPRGIGKSTICEALGKRHILYGDGHFVVYVSNSSTSAELYTENMKLDLMSNETLQKIGFEPVTINQQGLNEDVYKRLAFSKKSWVAYGRTLILPRGAGQQVRGLKWIRYRPDLLIVDDLEDDETIENPEQRRKLRQWFEGAFLRTVNRYFQNYRVIYIDTVKHEDALIQHLLDDPDWESLRLSAYVTDAEGNYKTTAPTFISQEELDKEVESNRRKGTLDILARELGSQPTSTEDNPFIKHIVYYKELDEDFLKRVNELEGVLIVDPSRTANMHSAPTGFLVFYFDYLTNMIYIHRAFGKRVHQNEMIDEIFDMCKRFRLRTFAVEVDGLEEHFTYPIRNEMVRRRQMHLEFLELRARSGKGNYAGVDKSKVGRARGLIPLYRQGLIKHCEAGTADLEIQESGYPRNKDWWALDCAAYIPQVLELGLRYMSPPDIKEDPSSIEKEYDQLKDEPALVGWETV